MLEVPKNKRIPAPDPAKPGTDRDHFFMFYKKQAFVRDHRFRLNDRGELFDIPVTSDATRYRERITTDPGHDDRKAEMQKLLEGYLRITPES